MLKKASTPMAILILVIMTLVLCTTALFIFKISERANVKIADARFIEKVYVQEEQVKFFLEGLEEDVWSSLRTSVDEPSEEIVFNRDFKEAVSNYKTEDEDFKVALDKLKKYVAEDSYKLAFDWNNKK